MSATTDLARQHGGCGKVIDADAWCDGDAVPSPAGLCDSPEKHREHAGIRQGLVDIGCPPDVADYIARQDEREDEARERWNRLSQLTGPVAFPIHRDTEDGQ